MNIHADRINALRRHMERLDIDYYIVPTGDPHNSEYVCGHYKVREYLSGFTGSAGTLLIMADKAILWTDGRYFVQAEGELSGSGVSLYKSGERDVPDLYEYLKSNIEPGRVIAFDPLMLNFKAYEKIREIVDDKSAAIYRGQELMDLAEAWPERPLVPAKKLEVLSADYCGQSVGDKLAELRAHLKSQSLDAIFISALDEIMWLLNVRGGDIPHNPVAFSHCLVDMSSVYLFIQPGALHDEVSLYLSESGITVKDYADAEAFLAAYVRDDPGRAISFDKGKISTALGLILCGSKTTDKSVGEGGTGEVSAGGVGAGDDSAGEDSARYDSLLADSSGDRSTALSDTAAGPYKQTADHSHGPAADPALPKAGRPVKGPSYISRKKAVKNPTELKYIREVYIKDSLMLTRFIRLLKQKRPADLTEYSAASMLDEMRLKTRGCLDLSFETISAYGANAAMMHYSAPKEGSAVIGKKGFLLIDSGGQYLGGTTDVTRTVAMGLLSPDEKRHFTAVAAGMLRLQNARFIKGCTGRNLDILARGPLWELGIDYKCGTGHGIGCMLGVHEGPHSIRTRFIEGAYEEELVPGMLVSDEPGVYMAGRYGIRTENILEVKSWRETSDGEFLCFAPLTYVPIDLDAIAPHSMQPQDLKNLNDYHRLVYEVLSRHMTFDEQAWLKYATRPL